MAGGRSKGERGWAGTETPFTVLQAQGSITCFPLAALASLFRGCRLGEICSGCRHQPRPHKRERGEKEREAERSPEGKRKTETGTETHKGKKRHERCRQAEMVRQAHTDTGRELETGEESWSSGTGQGGAGVGRGDPVRGSALGAGQAATQ